MKNLIKIVLTSALLLTACSKDDLICGEITGGGVDRFTGLLYLTVDDTKIWVDDKTYTSYYVGDYECFEDY
jgi:major membrane immunogen (membrane-anchored lipoprotein)